MDRARVVTYCRMRGTTQVGVFRAKGVVKMSGNNFIMMVVMILILLFVIMSIGPLFSIGG